MSSSQPPDLLDRLSAHRPPPPVDPPVDPPVRRAAVAAVLRVRAAPEVLLVRRTEHPLDPWSGHVSFPGGNRDPSDADLLATALRETREEVGLDLARDARLLCRLAPVTAIAKGRTLSMDITPFVFALDGSPALVLEAREVAESFWLPLDRAAAGEFDALHPYRDGASTRQLPSWNFEGRTVWGLTYRMLREMLRVATDGN